MNFQESKSESEIQSEIIKYLELRQFLVIRMNSGKARNNVRLCPPGTPDLMVVSPSGLIWWIEVKTETGKLRPAQVVMIDDLQNRKQAVIVARNIEDVRSVIDGIPKHDKKTT